MRKGKPCWSGPVCYNCGEAPAQPVGDRGAQAFGALFCSERCAARAAVVDCFVKGVYWCHHSRDWRSKDLPCSFCEQERLAAETGSAAGHAAQGAHGKGVDRG